MEKPDPVDKIVAGVQRFQQDVFPSQQALFEALGEGQQPRALLVTCSDSRIDPSLFTQTQPGELFIVRNAGNIVPPPSAGVGGESATIEYAVRALGVPHAIVCGHSHCGAMAAAANPESAAALPDVSQWIKFAESAVDRAGEFGSVDDEALRVIAANVLVQLDHLRSHPAVAEAEAEGRLQLHGWIYLFEEGEVVQVDSSGTLHRLAEV